MRGLKRRKHLKTLVIKGFLLSGLFDFVFDY